MVMDNTSPQPRRDCQGPPRLRARPNRTGGGCPIGDMLVTLRRHRPALRQQYLRATVGKLPETGTKPDI